MYKRQVKENFYKGREATVDECMRALRDATIANLVGSIVEHAVRAGLIDPRNVFKFEGVPHAQLVKM